MKRIYLDWTEKEKDFLRTNYYDGDTNYIISNLQNRKWLAIKKKAGILGAKRKSTRKTFNLDILLEDTPITYYWIGLLLADGNFTHRRLALGLHKNDLNHIKKLQKYVSSKNALYKVKGSNQYRLTITNINIIQKLRTKFGITNRKTYEPCHIRNIKNDDLLFSLIIGYIDGDGSIRIDKKHYSHLSIKCHASWKGNLDFMSTFLYRYFGDSHIPPSAKIIARKMSIMKQKPQTYHLANISISRTNIMKNMKKKSIDLHLPFMKRKIGKIT